MAKKTKDVEAAVQAYLAGEETVEAILRRCNVSKDTLYRRLNDRELPLRKPSVSMKLKSRTSFVEIVDEDDEEEGAIEI